MLRIATWNAGHRKDSWNILRSLDADIVLAQELPAPPHGEQDRTVYSPFAQRSNRPWGTAVWIRDLSFLALNATTSQTHEPREGITAVAEVSLPTGGVLTAISIHAADERIARRAPGATAESPANGYAVTSMHRVLSDLTGYLEDPRRKRGTRRAANLMVLGGDFNCNLGFDVRQKNPSHELVFARVAGFGLAPVLPVVAGDKYTTMTRGRVPYRQLDYLYTSAPTNVANPQILSTQALQDRKDHLPVMADVRF